MMYLFLFVVFIVVNIVVYVNFEFVGLLIYNLALLAISLVMIYDKITKNIKEVIGVQLQLQKLYRQSMYEKEAVDNLTEDAKD